MKIKVYRLWCQDQGSNLNHAQIQGMKQPDKGKIVTLKVCEEVRETKKVPAHLCISMRWLNFDEISTSVLYD